MEHDEEVEVGAVGRGGVVELPWLEEGRRGGWLGAEASGCIVDGSEMER